MKFSNFFIPTLKESPSDVKMRSHDLMIRCGMIRQETSGIYSWMPLGLRVLKKIIKKIELFHDNNHVNQILMPTIQSADIWKTSNRYDTYGKEMLRIVDRNNKDLLYGPTNEEMITALGKQYIKSYKSLPVKLYHIQSKFRDEIRPRFGVMRAREFLMKDAYSFDEDEKNGEKTYCDFFNLYLEIFKALSIPVIPVRALSGEIGGNLSHEFHLLVDSGESEIYLKDNAFDRILKVETTNDILKLESYTDDYFKEISNKDGFSSFKSIELGHIFLFGTKYSDSFKFEVDSHQGKFRPYMGSYGIGISRIPAAVIEHSNDEKGIVWPNNLSPFSVHLLNLLVDDSVCSDFCNKLYYELINKGIDVIYDDRLERPGIKFSDADLIGVPIQIVCGNVFKKSKQISIINRKNRNETNIDSEKLVDYLMVTLGENK
tara:strand:+ start:775 stop:2064 length:1290 start_codon:yes stop_codon:yes gene_type:complete